MPPVFRGTEMIKRQKTTSLLSAIEFGSCSFLILESSASLGRHQERVTHEACEAVCPARSGEIRKVAHGRGSILTLEAIDDKEIANPS